MRKSLPSTICLLTSEETAIFKKEFYAEIDTSGVRLEEDGTQKARLWLVRANDLPEMDELLTLRFNGLYHNMIKNIAETGRG